MDRRRLTKGEARWLGQEVYRLQGLLVELSGALPTFARQRLVHEGALNEYLDLVLREPEPDDERRVPVSTVSRKYALIQHRDCVAWICDAFERQGWDPSAVPITAWMSDYGERIRMEVRIPEQMIALREGDSLAADICLWNSVDRSRSFEVAIRWNRLVCKNGLAIWREDRFRRVHHADWMSRESPTDFIVERMPKSRGQTARIGEWRDYGIDLVAITAWVDGVLAERWGKTRAARTLFIARTGYDCAVGRSHAEWRASKLQVEPRSEVPGAPETTSNLFDLYQVLLWIARTEQALEKRETLAQEALELVVALLPEDQRDDFR